MKVSIHISILLLFVSNLSIAQQNDSLIKNIRTQYSNIRSQLTSFDTTMIEIWDESTEGGQAIGYYQNKELQLIEVVWLGEMGKRQIDYYFYEGKLFFAFAQDIGYNRPMYWDEKTAKENGDRECFDPKKSTITENRYYFNDEKLFLWLDNQKQAQDLHLAKNQTVSQKLLTHSNALKTRLEK